MRPLPAHPSGSLWPQYPWPGGPWALAPQSLPPTSYQRRKEQRSVESDCCSPASTPEGAMGSARGGGSLPRTTRPPAPGLQAPGLPEPAQAQPLLSLSPLPSPGGAPHLPLVRAEAICDSWPQEFKTPFLTSFPAL